MRYFKYLILTLMLACGSRAFAQLSTVVGKADYPFWLYLPEDSILQSHPPVLIFLHGRSLSGTDLNLVKKYGVITEIVRGRKIPGIVFAPQVKSGSAWDPDKVLNVLKYVQQHYDTDTNRVYVVGMSLGGYGTLHFSGKYPQHVAAAVALCGGGNPSDGCRLADIPLWIQHGKLDQAVPIAESEKMVAAIKACNGGKNLTYKVYEDWGHSQLARVFGYDEMYAWLWKQCKKPE
jgi:predicted peptidase